MLHLRYPTADCKLLFLHLEISLTLFEPLQPYFICLNCICSVITITISITIPITLTTISTPQALIYLLLDSLASSPSPRPSQHTSSVHEALSQPSSLLLTVLEFHIVQINCHWFRGRLNQFTSSSTSQLFRGTGVLALLALNWMFKSTSWADPCRTFADQPRLLHRWAQSIRLVEYIKIVQWHWSTCIIVTGFDVQIHLQGWPLSNCCRSTPINSLPGSVDCKGTYASARPYRHTYGNDGIRLQTWTRVIVNRCIGKIIARDLSLVASWLYRWPLLGPGSRAAVTLSLSLGADLLGCINRTREKERKGKQRMKQSSYVRNPTNR